MDPEEQTQGAIDTQDIEPAVDESAGLDTSARPDADYGPEESGVNPIVGKLSANLNKFNQAQPPQAGEQIQSPLAQPAMQKPNTSRIASLIMGEGAKPPALLDALDKEVDPHGQFTASDRAVLGVEKIAQEGGLPAAHAVMQTHRVAFNPKQLYAYTAATGTQTKPPDLEAAVDAANKAERHVLDGSSAHFALTRAGVTATVTTPDHDVQQYNLTPQQFQEFLNPKGAGQWDRLMKVGVPGTLQQITANSQSDGDENSDEGPRPWNSGTQAMAPESEETRQERADNIQQKSADDFRGAHQAPDSEAVRTGKPVEYSLDAFDRGGASGKGAGNQPAIPGTHDKHGHYLGPKDPDRTHYGPELEARADATGLTNPAEKAAYKDKQEQASLDREAKVRAEQTKGEAATRRAEITAGGRLAGDRIKADSGVQRATIRAGATVEQAKQAAVRDAEKQAALSQRAWDRNKAAIFRSLVSDPNTAIRTDGDIQKLAQRAGLTMDENGAISFGQTEGHLPFARVVTAAPTGQAKAPPSGQPQQAPGGAKKMFNGKLYTREEYEREVLGK